MLKPHFNRVSDFGRRQVAWGDVEGDVWGQTWAHSGPVNRRDPDRAGWRNEFRAILSDKGGLPTIERPPRFPTEQASEEVADTGKPGLSAKPVNEGADGAIDKNARNVKPKLLEGVSRIVGIQGQCGQAVAQPVGEGLKNFSVRAVKTV